MDPVRPERDLDSFPDSEPDQDPVTAESLRNEDEVEGWWPAMEPRGVWVRECADSEAEPDLETRAEEEAEAESDSFTLEAQGRGAIGRKPWGLWWRG